MSDGKPAFPTQGLSKRTSIFGLRLWVVMGISLGAAIVLFFFLISLWVTSRRSKRKISILPQSNKNNNNSNSPPTPIPNVSREIRVDPTRKPDPNPTSSGSDQMLQRIHIEIGKGHRITYPDQKVGSRHGSGEARPVSGPEVSHLGWGHWYTLRELEEASNGFADENVIGQGGYGIVYRGVFGDKDNTHVAIKNLLNNRGQAEREFKVEVEAIGRVRHKNLVRLIGYCAEGAHRMLVYEYVNNGNLEQWLHGDVGPCSPLTWDIRMNIILGTAKGLSYLHECLEPKVIHRDIKSSNILLDKHWNAKVSDFGLAKLIGSDRSYITTRVMGTFGYVAPEYASTGMLNESSDVYSFGILIMEIITGRTPVDYSRPPGEVNLVDWVRAMISNRKSEGISDPKLPEKPSLRALKRTLLVALRCVDPNAQKRPKMGHVLHMLEAENYPSGNDRKKEHQRLHGDFMKRDKVVEMRMTEPEYSSGYESNAQTDDRKRAEIDEEQ